MQVEIKCMRSGDTICTLEGVSHKYGTCIFLVKCTIFFDLFVADPALNSC